MMEEAFRILNRILQGNGIRKAALRAVDDLKRTPLDQIGNAEVFILSEEGLWWFGDATYVLHRHRWTWRYRCHLRLTQSGNSTMTFSTSTDYAGMNELKEKMSGKKYKALAKRNRRKSTNDCMKCSIEKNSRLHRTRMHTSVWEADEKRYAPPI